jgi:hypothetical protein
MIMICAKSEVKQHIFNQIKYNFDFFIGPIKKMQEPLPEEKYDKTQYKAI